MEKVLRAKRDELKTYRLLGLSRIRKQVARQPSSSRGRLIGGELPDRPALIVNNSEYCLAWQQALEAVRAKYKQTPLATAFDTTSLHAEIEEVAYQLLLRRYMAQSSLRQVCERYGVDAQSANRVLDEIYENFEETRSETPCAATYPAYRAAIVDELLTRIRNRNDRSSANISKAWREIIGEELYRHSTIQLYADKDAVLIIRASNSVVAHHIRQIKHHWLPKLEEKLGLKLKRWIIRS